MRGRYPYRAKFNVLQIEKKTPHSMMLPRDVIKLLMFLFSQLTMLKLGPVKWWHSTGVAIRTR